MRSVAWRLLLAFLAVAAVAVGTVAFVANQTTSEGFRTYVEMGSSMYARRLAQTLADYYARSGSWQSVEGVLANLVRTTDERLVLADAGGTIVADTGRQWAGKRASELSLASGTAVVLGERHLGELYVLSSAVGQGMGPMGSMMGRAGMGMPWRTDATSTITPEESFLADVNRGILLGALSAGALAILLSLLLTRQIVRPLGALAAGARRLQTGDLTHRVQIGSRDELGEVARAFNAMAESLERNESARRHLLADVAHELRTPLTVIEGTADGILDGVLEPTREQIGIIKEEAGLLAKLVADLRDLSLAEAGQLHLDRRPTDLAELIERVARGFEPAARERGQELALNLDGALPPYSVDATRLAQVVKNLLANAVRHTPPGGRLTVTLGADPAAPGWALIVVADTGEGIPAADLPHVFERFYRADKSRSRRSGGSGLGLAIVKQLVEAHGGRVWAESQPGRGSSFAISLPRG